MHAAADFPHRIATAWPARSTRRMVERPGPQRGSSGAVSCGGPGQYNYDRQQVDNGQPDEILGGV